MSELQQFYYRDEQITLRKKTWRLDRDRVEIKGCSVTLTQLKLLSYKSMGYENEEIATMRGTVEQTVKNQLEQIKDYNIDPKTNIRPTTHDLVLLCAVAGILEPITILGIEQELNELNQK